MTDQDNFLVAQQLIGRSISPLAAQASRQLCLDIYEHSHFQSYGASMSNIRYGMHPRHKMDIYLPEHSPSGIVIFVHGGGYTSGDKTLEDGVFHALTARWLTEQGLIAVTINYRLAPEHTWPDAAQDVLSVHEFLKESEHLPKELCSKLPIFWWGHSAGASHVADALALATGNEARPAAALLMSGAYDLTVEPERLSQRAYYGSEPATLAARSSLLGLEGLETPLCLIHAELDPVFFQIQKNRLVDLRRKKHHRDAQLLAKGFNHFTQLYHLGLHDSSLSIRLKRFIQSYVT